MPMPVSVIVPMTIPTSAQARPTGSAWRAPSAKASMQAFSTSRPERLRSTFQMTRSRTTPSTVATLIDIDAAEISAKPTQKTIRRAGVASPAEIASARMSATVRARPIAPAKSGVKPANRR